MKRKVKRKNGRSDLSDLKNWASKRWMFAGHVAAALGMIEWHKQNTALSPTELTCLHLIKNELQNIQNFWDSSSVLTRTETLLGYGYKKGRPPGINSSHDCQTEGHQYAHVKYTSGKLLHPDYIYQVKRCRFCGKEYYQKKKKKQVFKVVDIKGKVAYR